MYEICLQKKESFQNQNSWISLLDSFRSEYCEIGGDTCHCVRESRSAGIITMNTGFGHKSLDNLFNTFRQSIHMLYC